MAFTLRELYDACTAKRRPDTETDGKVLPGRDLVNFSNGVNRLLAKPPATKVMIVSTGARTACRAGTRQCDVSLGYTLSHVRSRGRVWRVMRGMRHPAGWWRR